MNKHAIAMVAACPFPANHGTPAAIREMAQELARRGHAVRVVTYPLSDNIPISGVAIDRVRQVGFNRQITVGPSYQRLLFDFLLIFKLLQVVRRHGIEIIHAHNYEATLIAGIVGRLTGVPVIYNAINTMIGELPSFRFIRPKAAAVGLAKVLDYLTPRLADAVIADTAELRQFILDRGIAPERVTTIHSGVWPDMFANGDGGKVRAPLGLQNKSVILYTGTFDEFQGMSYLLCAFEIVRRKDPTAHLLLVGSTVPSHHRQKYQAMAERLGVRSSVTITQCSLEELSDYLAAGDIAVVPRPDSAGIPTKLLNYMAAGKAIVSFAASARILEDGKTARLIQTRTAEALANGISDLLSNRSLALQLGRNARNCIDGRFDWPTVADQIEALYDKVASQLQPQRRRMLSRQRRRHLISQPESLG